MTKEERIQLLIEKVANLSYQELEEMIHELEAESGLARRYLYLAHCLVHSGDKDD